MQRFGHGLIGLVGVNSFAVTVAGDVDSFLGGIGMDNVDFRAISIDFVPHFSGPLCVSQPPMKCVQTRKGSLVADAESVISQVLNQVVGHAMIDHERTPQPLPRLGFDNTPFPGCLFGLLRHWG
jgi:hypothetical protein